MDFIKSSYGFDKIQLVGRVADLREGLIETLQLPNDYINFIEQIREGSDGVDPVTKTICQLAEDVFDGSIGGSIGGARLDVMAKIGLNGLVNYGAAMGVQVVP